MLLRSMAPEVIATDEIGTAADVRALRKAVCSGVSVIATMHSSLRDFTVPDPLFEKAIFLSSNPKPGTVCEIRSF